jgi:phosphoribosyl-ATP pyrophosphohydrolase
MSEAIKRYQQFVQLVENTPIHMRAMPYSAQRALHAAIGMSTEAAELLDVFKKHMYGKEKPLDAEAQNNLRDECGDMFYYLMLMLDAIGYDFNDMIEHNTEKLRKRYALTAEG